MMNSFVALGRIHKALAQNSDSGLILRRCYYTVTLKAYGMAQETISRWVRSNRLSA